MPATRKRRQAPPQKVLHLTTYERLEQYLRAFGQGHFHRLAVDLHVDLGVVVSFRGRIEAHELPVDVAAKQAFVVVAATEDGCDGFWIRRHLGWYLFVRTCEVGGKI